MSRQKLLVMQVGFLAARCQRDGVRQPISHQVSAFHALFAVYDDQLRVLLLIPQNPNRLFLWLSLLHGGSHKLQHDNHSCLRIPPRCSRGIHVSPARCFASILVSGQYSCRDMMASNILLPQPHWRGNVRMSSLLLTVPVALMLDPNFVGSLCVS